MQCSMVLRNLSQPQPRCCLHEQVQRHPQRGTRAPSRTVWGSTRLLRTRANSFGVTSQIAVGICCSPYLPGRQWWTQMSWVTVQRLKYSFSCASLESGLQISVGLPFTPLVKILYKLGHCSIAVRVYAAKVNVDLNLIRYLNFSLVW